MMKEECFYLEVPDERDLMHISTRPKARTSSLIVALVAAFIGLTLTVAVPGASAKAATSANVIGATSQTTPQAMGTTATTYPTSSSGCASATNIYARFCARIAELTPGSMFAYGTAYENAGRPLVRSVTATVRIWGYGTNGTLRDLGISYSRTYDMTAIFGRPCSVDVAGGWSGIASGSCQIQGPNWNLTAGNLYAATSIWRLTRASDGSVTTVTARTGWVQAKG